MFHFGPVHSILHWLFLFKVIVYLRNNEILTIITKSIDVLVTSFTVETLFFFSLFIVVLVDVLGGDSKARTKRCRVLF